MADLSPPQWHTARPYEFTYGPEVVRLNTALGYTPDPEQALILDDWFAVDGDNVPVHFEAGLIAPRQNLKSGALKQAAIGWLGIKSIGVERATFSTHNFATTRELMGELHEMIKGYAPLRRRLAPGVNQGFYKATGGVRIVLRDGRYIRAKARTKNTDRGLTGDRVVMDEAFSLDPEQMAAIQPSVSARPRAQILYASSAGLRQSAFLRSLRDRGRIGEDDLCYAEWGSDPGHCLNPECDHAVGSIGCMLDDEELLAAVNTAVGNGRMRMRTLRAERRSARPDPLKFARERLGWWDDPPTEAGFDPAIDIDRFNNLADEDSHLAGAPSFGVAMDIGRENAAVIAAGKNETGKLHVEVVEAHGLRSEWGAFGRGKDGLVAFVAELAKRHGAEVGIDSRGPASDLVADLRDAGCRVQAATTGEVLDGVTETRDAVKDGRLAHTGDAILTTAVAVTPKRMVGDRPAVERKKAVGDTSPVEAMCLAIHLASAGDTGPNVW